MRGTWHRRQPGGTIDARTRQSNRFWQIVNSFIPFVAVWYLAYRALAVSHWLTPYFYWRQQLLHKAVLTFWLSLKCIFLNLWDEEQQKLLSFRALRAIPTAG